MSLQNKVAIAPAATVASAWRSCSNSPGCTPTSSSIMCRIRKRPTPSSARSPNSVISRSASKPRSAKSLICQMLVDQAVNRFGRVDIMVNNAGVETRTGILDTAKDQYDRVMAVNPKSAFFGDADRRQADDPAGRRRTHHQHQLGSRGLADARQHRLLPVERRHAHADAHGRGRTRPT
jgi:hypothetical protein